MSGHNAPSPAPRSASVGPNGLLPTPTSAPMVNGITGGNAPGPAAPQSGPTTSAGAQQQMSQQNLNQIVRYSLNPRLELHRCDICLRICSL